MKAARQSFLFLLTLSACISLTACASVEKLFIKPVTTPKVVEVAAVTNYVPVIVPGPVQTQIITQTVAGASVTITNTIETTRVITNTVFVPAHTETQDVITGYGSNPSLVTGVDKARELNKSLNPTPTAPFVDWGLGLVTLLAAAYANFKTRQLNKSQTVVGQLKEVTGTLIAAVESYPSETTKDLKDHVKETAVLQGTQKLVDKEVQQVTKA